MSCTFCYLFISSCSFIFASDSFAARFSKFLREMEALCSLISFDYFGDIYDGSVWKNFLSDFLSAPYSYLLTMDVDWFQPYIHV